MANDLPTGTWYDLGADKVRGGLRIGFVWLAAALAFSPVLLDLGRHMAAEPWTHYSVVFAGLLLWCAVNEPRSRPSRDGYVWLALGLLIELVAVGGGAMRLGRLGLPLAVIGICRVFGLASPRTAALALWIVPIPMRLAELASPALESLWLRLSASIANLFGAGVVVDGSWALISGNGLALQANDAGLPLLALLTGLGWYASLRLRSGTRQALVHSAAWGALAVPLQILAVLLATVTLVCGAPGIGRFALTTALWSVIAIVGIAWTERRHTRLSGPGGI